jgi:hypothetical protein
MFIVFDEGFGWKGGRKGLEGGGLGAEKACREAEGGGYGEGRGRERRGDRGGESG